MSKKITIKQQNGKDNHTENIPRVFFLIKGYTLLDYM